MDDLDVAAVVSLLVLDCSPDGDSNDVVGSAVVVVVVALPLLPVLFFFFFLFFFLAAAVLLGEGVAIGDVGRCCFSLLLRFYIFERRYVTHDLIHF